MASKLQYMDLLFSQYWYKEKMKFKNIYTTIAAISSFLGLSYGIQQDTLNFNHPFSDSFAIKVLPEAISTIDEIVVEKIYGTESNLFFEFSVGLDRYIIKNTSSDTSFYSQWSITRSAPYKKFSSIEIGSGKSVMLYKFSIRPLPLFCTCENAGASFPSPHLFKIKFRGQGISIDLFLKGSIYIVPPDRIIGNLPLRIIRPKNKFTIQGKRKSSMQKSKSVGQLFFSTRD